MKRLLLLLMMLLIVGSVFGDIIRSEQSNVGNEGTDTHNGLSDNIYRQVYKQGVWVEYTDMYNQKYVIDPVGKVYKKNDLGYSTDGHKLYTKDEMKSLVSNTNSGDSYIGAKDHTSKTNYDTNGVNGINIKIDGELDVGDGNKYVISGENIYAFDDSGNSKGTLLTEEPNIKDGTYTITSIDGKMKTYCKGYQGTNDVKKYYPVGTLAAQGKQGNNVGFTEIATPTGWKKITGNQPVKIHENVIYGMDADGKGFYCDGQECSIKDGQRVTLKDSNSQKKDSTITYTVASNELWTEQENGKYKSATGDSKDGSWGDTFDDCKDQPSACDIRCTTGKYDPDAGCTTVKGAHDFEVWSHDVNGLLTEMTTWASYGAGFSNLFLGNDAWGSYKDWQTRFFENNVFGKFMMRDFEEAFGLCKVDFKGIDDTQTVMVDIGGDLNQYGMHIEGEKINLSDQGYVYKVSFYVYNNYDEKPEEEINYWNIMFDNGDERVPYYNEWQNISEESTYAGTGSNMIARQSNNTYTEVCLVLENPITDYEGHERRQVCNAFTEYEGKATTYDIGKKEKTTKAVGGSGSGKINENI